MVLQLLKALDLLILMIFLLDTWLMLKEDFLNERETVLLYWIPNKAIELMQRAIDVEICESYYWLDEKSPK
ncbi:MAG: hypothetical protein ACI85I_000180 [Arenicella sp.]|jgi:hypothetical protein